MNLKIILSVVLLVFVFVPAVDVLAGPVPGVEAINKKAVEFPYPEHMEVWETDEGDFLVTFRWKPDVEVEEAAIAGTFNGWKRKKDMLSGPDEDGEYEISLRLKDGIYEYKFVANEDDWFQDKRNPDEAVTVGGDPNSVLNIGLFAVMKDLNPVRGDGSIEKRVLEHDPTAYTYFDPQTKEEVLIRYRTLKNDPDGVTLVLVESDSSTAGMKMKRVASKGYFEFYEVLLNVSDLEIFPQKYSFLIEDGDLSLIHPKNFDFNIDPEKIFKTPEWAKSAVWYQIMVDRFRDGDPKNNPEKTVDSSTVRSKVTHPWTSDWYEEQPWEREGTNGDGSQRSFWEWAMYERLYGGDFEGVIEKLDYIQELGVNAIYFNPVFEASGNSHKYNGKSFLHMDDGYGVPGEFDKAMVKIDYLDPETWYFNKSDKKFLKLLKECKKRGIRVIIDGVFNHLGDDSVSFTDVKKNMQESRFANWYQIDSWEPFEYTGWAGYGGLPEFKKNDETGLDPELVKHIYNVTRRWMDPNGDGDPSDGIDGWRLDVPMEVPDIFWENWRVFVKSINPDAYIVGEIWSPAEQWLNGKQFDAVMNYQFSQIAFRFFGNVEKKSSATEFEQELAHLRLRYPKSATYVMQNLYDSHDTDRWVSRIANPDLKYDGSNRKQDEDGADYFDKKPEKVHYEKMKLMAAFQATYVGAPMIWYGTEAGMFGADDPMCRMPMWWKDLGDFDNPEYGFREDIFNHFKALFTIRQYYQALNVGEYLTLLVDDEKESITYLRYLNDGSESLVVALNNSPRKQLLEIEAPKIEQLPNGFKRIKPVFVNPESKLRSSKELLTMEIPALQGAIIRVLNKDEKSHSHGHGHGHSHGDHGHSH